MPHALRLALSPLQDATRFHDVYAMLCFSPLRHMPLLLRHAMRLPHAAGVVVAIFMYKIYAGIFCHYAMLPLPRFYAAAMLPLFADMMPPCRH